MNMNFEVIKAHYAAPTPGFDGDDGAGHQPTAWTEMAGFPYAGTYVGPDAIIDGVFKRIGEDWDGYALKLEKLVDGDTTIVGIGTYSGACKKTGKPMSARVVHVWDMEDGKAVRFRAVHRHQPGRRGNRLNAGSTSRPSVSICDTACDPGKEPRSARRPPNAACAFTSYSGCAKVQDGSRGPSLLSVRWVKSVKRHADDRCAKGRHGFVAESEIWK